ncbi:MAG: T9SS type A sorting domain-containing protein [Bacteroidota bacterium]
MKKILFSFAALLCVAMISNAQTWTQQNTAFPGTSIGVDEISVVNNNIVWVKGFNGSGTGAKIRAFSKTTNGGTTWTAGTIGLTGTIMPNNFATSNGTRAFVVCLDTVSSAASFWGTSNGGTTWAPVTGILNSTSSFADGVEFWSQTQGFCYGDPVGTPAAFEIYTTSDGGATWTPAVTSVAPSPATEYGYNGAECSCVVPGTGVGFIFSDHGRVLRTTDYGVHWAVTPTAPFTSSVYNSNKIYASSANYIICATYLTATTTWTWKYTSDGGTTWNAFAPTGNFYEYAMTYVPGTPNKFVATSPFSTGIMGVGYSTNGGLSWTDFTDALLQPSGTNIQCLGVGFFDVTTGWVGNYGASTNTILKYYDPYAGINMMQTVNGNDVNIYPNPSHGMVNIAVNGPNTADISVTVLDLMGNVVLKSNLNVVEKTESAFDLTGYAKGVYLVQLSSGSEVVTKKIVIQ